jgi:FkbM family methyltransferase
MKRTIQSVANALGYEVHSLSSSVPNRRFRMMERLGINIVLDVGANAGQYASGLRKSGYKGRIRSYEPLHEAFASLSIKAAHDNAWIVVNSACGAKKQTATINVAKNSYSSSLLPILDKHVQNAKDSKYMSQEEISVCSLDEEVLSSLTANDKVWLKIDTQGYEAEVLKGAVGLMARVSGVECELSILPLYDGQPLIDEMIHSLYEKGLRMVDVAPGFCESETGYALQIDGIFLRM